MDHQRLYKLKSNREHHSSRLKNFQTKCQEKRNDIFQASRLIVNSPEPTNNEKENISENKNENITNKILKKVEKQEAFYAKYLAWKKEKDIKRMQEKMQQKKPFYTACSKLNTYNKKNINSTESKKVELKEIAVPKKSDNPITSKDSHSINNLVAVNPVKKQNSSNNMRAPQKIPVTKIKKQTIPTKIFKSKDNITEEKQIIPTKGSISQEPTTSKNLRKIKSTSVEQVKTNIIEKPIKKPSIKLKSVLSKKENKFTFLNEKKSISVVEQTPIPEHPFKLVTSTLRKSANNNLINSDELFDSTISPIDFKNDATDMLVNLNKSQDQNYWPSPMQQPRKSLLSSTLKINYLSPFVSTSRGKVSAKKEKEKRDSIYLLDNTSPEEISITTRRMKEAVRHFYKLLNDESERLQDLCNDWKQYINENIDLLNENGGIDMINVTLGQAKLLLTKKFKQFHQLIEKCENYTIKNKNINENCDGEKPIYPEDLEGFWGMVNIQIDDIDKRFHNIKKWKENNWIDPDDIKPKNKKLRPLSMVCKKPKKNTTKPSSKIESILKKLISDGKKNKLNRQQENDDIIIVTKSAKHQSSSKENTPLRRRSSPKIPKRISTPNKKIENYENESTSKKRRKSKSTTPGLKKNNNENIIRQKSSTRSEWKCVNLLKPTNEMIATTPVQPSRKSILRTPGTLRKNCNVIFNEELDFKSPNEQILLQKTSEQFDLSTGTREKRRSLRLRTRKLMIDPDATIDLPK